MWYSFRGNAQAARLIFFCFFLRLFFVGVRVGHAQRYDVPLSLLVFPLSADKLAGHGRLVCLLDYLHTLLELVVLALVGHLSELQHANKVAQKRLKKAGKLLKDNQKEAFYEEIERAAWTYLSDRLSIPTADLNKDNIASILHGKGVSDDLIKEVNNVLSTAEFARYAPSSDHAMDDLYKATNLLIDQLEEQKL